MSRYYKRDGVEKPSVTTICGQLDKPALLQWAVGCAVDYIIVSLPSFSNDELPDHPAGTLLHMSDIVPLIESARTNFRQVSKNAMDAGSRVHDAIEQYLKTGREPFKPSDEVMAGFLSFLEWQDAHHLKTLQTEHTVYGDRYAGTLDLLCELNGKQYVIDFKTTSVKEGGQAYSEHRYQTAAYRQCIPGTVGHGVLYLHKQTGYPYWKDCSATYEADVKVFNILVDLFYASHPIVSKRIATQIDRKN
jgi:hypothetical protein